jgi:hypothetical protein
MAAKFALPRTKIHLKADHQKTLNSLGYLLIENGIKYCKKIFYVYLILMLFKI